MKSVAGQERWRVCNGMQCDTPKQKVWEVWLTKCRKEWVKGAQSREG